jgi:hypothetical protein
MHANDANFQLVPPGIYRRNAAERAIRTFKNHFIAGLSIYCGPLQCRQTFSHSSLGPTLPTSRNHAEPTLRFSHQPKIIRMGPSPRHF